MPEPEGNDELLQIEDDDMPEPEGNDELLQIEDDDVPESDDDGNSPLALDDGNALLELDGSGALDDDSDALITCSSGWFSASTQVSPFRRYLMSHSSSLHDSRMCGTSVSQTIRDEDAPAGLSMLQLDGGAAPVVRLSCL